MWAGFAIKRVSDGQIALIVSNTATVLTLASNAQNYSPPPWAAGNQYKIHRVLVALHQSSRGQGDVITGVNSDYTNTITNSQAWPHQKLEPAYGWNNKYTPNNTSVPIVGGVNICINLFKENRDYYNQAAPVSGVQTVGVGVGTLSNRPASGVNGVDITGVTTNPPGTAYWATDKA